MPIYDENGNGIDAIAVPVTEETDEDETVLTIDTDGSLIARKAGRKKQRPVIDEIIIPEKRTSRQHYAAHLFKRMLDDGFNPRDPAQFVAKVQRDHALPGMPTEAEWEQGKFSLGEMHTRQTLATEILAQALAGLVERVAALEAAQGERRG